VPSSGRTDLLVVCSSGGHLTDALAIAPAWRDRSCAWVSFDKADVRSQLAGQRLYIAHGPTNRSIANLLRNLPLAWRVLRETRPQVVVTTGAGVGVPFAWIARLLGARVVFVECAGRVDRLSLSARLIAPVASRLLVQWPELAREHRHAQYAGNLLLRRRAAGSAPPGSGVLVTVGTNEAPFHRLLHAVSGLDADEPVIVQHGASSVRPDGAQCVAFLPFDELDELIRRARVVVCHAGIGSVAAALAQGRRPIVVPRVHRLGEAVDDHQVDFARRLEASGLATVVEDVGDLPAIIAGEQPVPAHEDGPDVATAVAAVLDELFVSSGSRGRGRRAWPRRAPRRRARAPWRGSPRPGPGWPSRSRSRR
jgi:beta-1,4-N-acetylglucosaminyltransferase